MKSELTTLQPKENEFPKLMRHKSHSMVILATEKLHNGLTGTVIWVEENSQSKVGEYSKHWDASSFTDLPRTECVILSNP